MTNTAENMNSANYRHWQTAVAHTLSEAGLEHGYGAKGWTADETLGWLDLRAPHMLSERCLGDGSADPTIRARLVRLSEIEDEMLSLELQQEEAAQVAREDEEPELGPVVI